jgi:L-alanine-DL-glutamate epimerase-like enolase superfamily enzyme
LSNSNWSRRSFFSASAAAGAASLVHPAALAAQSAGIRTGDLPDLTIKEAKVYVTDIGDVRRLNSTENGEIVSLVTASGIEGNYSIGNRGNPPGWLDYAKAACVGKNVFDLLPTIAYGGGRRPGAGGGGARGGAGAAPAGGRGGAGAAGGGRGAARGGAGAAPPAGARGGGGSGGGAFGGGFGFAARRARQNPASGPDIQAAICDVCLWDILGKAVNRPIYKILGNGGKDRLLAYASSQHLATVEDFGPDALKAKAAGLKGYKIHPGGGQRRSGGNIPGYLGHIDEIKEVRKAVGDDYTLLFDPVQRYNYFEALKVGRVLDQQGYVSFEDPMPTTEIEALVELRKNIDTPIEVGEFILDVYDFPEYIKRGAMDIVRLIADNLGGITGSFRVGQMADAFGMPCTPHNWGNGFDLAVHFQLELALPNCYWFEMPWPWEYVDRPYMAKIRTDENGYVRAPTDPGLGYALDRAAMEKITKRIDR